MVVGKATLDEILSRLSTLEKSIGRPIILRLFRATCADTACCGALQHPRVPPDDGTGQHRSRVGRFRVVDSGLSSVPRKLQQPLQREACDAAMNCVAVRDRSYRKPIE
jgi:hypothetical protein